MLLLHRKFQRATRRNKDFSGRGASPSAPCMTWFSLLFSSFFLSFLGARSQQPPAPRRQPEFQQIRAVFCWGILVVAAAAGLVLCVLILHVAEGFASADATKGHENKRSLRSPFGNLRITRAWKARRVRTSAPSRTNPCRRERCTNGSIRPKRRRKAWFSGLPDAPSAR